LYLVRFWCWFS